MERITVNLAGKSRRETLHGRPFIVAPLSMIVPGVLNGSNGPLLYPVEELKRNVDAWNGMPITVGHPTKSARSPKVIDETGIGTVFNAHVNGKLTAEGWFDVEALSRIEPSILNALESGRQIELSTGLATSNEPQQGTADNGREYIAVARNHRPDHLAILLNETGACSIRDGCGVNNKETDMDKNERKHIVDALVTNCDCWQDSDRETLNALDDDKLQSFHKAFVSNNEMKNAGDMTDEELEAEMKRRKKNKGTTDNSLDIRRKPLTEDEWLSEAPASVREAFEHAQLEQKRPFIEKIIQNTGADESSVRELQELSRDELERMARYIPERPKATSNYSGAATPAYNLGRRGAYSTNREFRSAALPRQVIDWSEKVN